MVNATQTPEYGNIHQAGHDGGDFLFVRRWPVSLSCWLVCFWWGRPMLIW